MSLIPANDGLPGDLISPDDPKISPVRILISDQVESEKNTLWQTSTTMKNPLKKW
jgi:hypothetical protein